MTEPTSELPRQPSPRERPEIIGAGEKAAPSYEKIRKSFDNYNRLMVKLVGSDLSLDETRKSAEQLNKEEQFLMEAGMIKQEPWRLRAAWRAAIPEEILDVEIAKLQAKESLTEAEDFLLKGLQYAKSERIILQSFKDQVAIAAERLVKREEKPEGEPDDVWRASHLLKHPREVQRLFEEEEKGGEEMVRRAVRDYAQEEATNFLTVRHDITDESRFEGRPELMADQIADGAAQVGNIKNRGAVLFVSARMAGLPEEKAALFAGEVLAHAHLEGIRKTDKKEPNLEEIYRLSGRLLECYGSPVSLEKYGRQNGKKLYEAVSKYVKPAEEKEKPSSS